MREYARESKAWREKREEGARNNVERLCRVRKETVQCKYGLPYQSDRGGKLNSGILMCNNCRQIVTKHLHDELTSFELTSAVAEKIRQ
eukprot:6196575-Pleurochrysis_carterae.AAC.1